MQKDNIATRCASIKIFSVYMNIRFLFIVPSPILELLINYSLLHRNRRLLSWLYKGIYFLLFFFFHDHLQIEIEKDFADRIFPFLFRLKFDSVSVSIKD